MTKTKIKTGKNSKNLKEDIKNGLANKFEEAKHYPHIMEVIEDTAEEDAQMIIDILKKWIYRINKDVVNCKTCDNYILKELKKELLK